MVKNPPANAGHVGSIPGWGRSPEEGNGNLLQYFCLENLMDSGASWAIYSLWGCKRVGHDLVTAAAAKSLQPCLTLCDPIDGSPPGSPIPGILQARTLE